MSTKLFVDIESGGFAAGEYHVMMNGRRVGKSTYYDVVREWEELMKRAPKYSVADRSEVDGDVWYTIRTDNKQLASWIRNQDRDLRVETTANYPMYFDVHEKLFTMLQLKWS